MGDDASDAGGKGTESSTGGNSPVEDFAHPFERESESFEAVELGDVRRDLDAPRQLLSRLAHAVLAGAEAVRAEVLRLHRAALAAAEVLKLVGDHAALECVDDESFDRRAVVLCRAALAGPGLSFDEQGHVPAQVEI